ncbi:MAG: long-chain-fatty-acid--CoA ligase [Candidatus Lambdaproteobacteria bacterium RIFOXYD1_FULL_56_27]|uniref:Long-chain-fatty-acid--CoA ligase n=1 Tax=Candidatus Lambdaproteobacteria bacterium RIFOXYD2_FULL_56_26 TaxID=1817773 RepID=A0A1F6GSF8_9PROT|nr:MAG: long-chain-fatty-acid--CoA ligase [Candidatus Lambdaproteobacteria bacterium RIFOXYD2_FULL_56_26]OGH01343.1 MAG: long-chain-fatty-acid--CoA ligase [Candidatus Lambdaproteobacteria bacterium RIFOXYC1_FULL_56_13]OGH06884.1 MAG: long-chain-fatty-acid--CoA ligase [Candidatus Lambdaproteobacteria bacterium RIFOXYD1_FULL_56_27]
MDKPWLKQYLPGVPETIDPDRYSSLGAMLEESFLHFADRPAFHNLGKTITYRELDLLSRAFAATLCNNLGYQKGDRVAIMMPNVLQYPVVLYGILRAGLIAVNVNPLYTPRELKHQMLDSGAKGIVILANFAHTLAEVEKDLPLQDIWVTEVGDLVGGLKGHVVNFVVKRIKKMVPPYRLQKNSSLLEALETGKGQSLKTGKVTGEDIAFLQYTGGTTGVSKGAVLTHRNMVANVLQAESWIGGTFNPGEEVAITPLPLYHIFSLTANCLFIGKIGGLNVLITNPRDFPVFFKELKHWPFTFITGVNTLFLALLNKPQIKEVDFSHLKIALAGGMAVTQAVATKWAETTGHVLLEAYGLTETSPAACINPTNLQTYNGFIGLPISSTVVALMDEEGRPVHKGEPGELCIKGPQVTQGYWKKPEETAKLFTPEGWLKTGDIATINEQGYVKLIDRKKDMILVSGFNVYPNEIEDVVSLHEGVLEVAAIGVPDEAAGEAVKIYVVKRDPKLTEGDVMAHCRKNLTGYKRPKYIEFLNELPKTNVGKILRRALREPAAKA